MGKKCVNTLITRVNQKLYEWRSKKRKRDFTWKRKIIFPKLIWLIPGMVNASSQNALERFFPWIGKADVRVR